MPSSLTGTLAALCLATVASAQAFTISDAQLTFRWVPTATFDSASADMTAGCTSDNLYAWHWAYAVVGSPGQPLDDLGHGAYAQQVSGNGASQQITNVDSLGLMNAAVTDVATATSSSAGYVTHTLTLTNTSANPLALRVYVMWDVDFNSSCCTPADETMPFSNASRFVITDTAPCGGCFECQADAPDHYGVSLFLGDVSTALTNGTDLLDAGLPFGPDDFTGAFEWVVNLAPSASRTLVARTGHNDLWTGQLGNTAHSGPVVGGATGAPTLSSARPVLGLPLAINIANAGPGSSATVLFGAGGPPLTLPNCGGLTVGLSLVLASIPVPLTAGNGTLHVNGSVCDPAIAGIAFSWQAFAIDATSPACLPLIHSDVLTTTFGD